METEQDQNKQPVSTLVRPEQPEGELTAASPEKEILAFADYNTWREFSGRTDLTDEQLTAQMTERKAALVVEYTAKVEELRQAAGEPGKTTTETASENTILAVDSDANVASQVAAVVANDQAVEVKEEQVKIEQKNDPQVPSAKPPQPNQQQKAQQGQRQPQQAQQKAAQPSTPHGRVEQRVVAVAKSSFAGLVDQVRENGTSNEKSLISTFDEFAATLAYRKVVDGAVGVMLQRKMLMALKFVLDIESPTEFKRLWNIALGLFNENKSKDGVFYPTRRERFINLWKWSDTELTALLNLYNLMDLTSDPITRDEGLKRVSMETALRVGFTEAQRQRLNNFYLG